MLTTSSLDLTRRFLREYPLIKTINTKKQYYNYAQSCDIHVTFTGKLRVVFTIKFQYGNIPRAFADI